MNTGVLIDKSEHIHTSLLRGLFAGSYESNRKRVDRKLDNQRQCPSRSFETKSQKTLGTSWEG